MDIIFAATLNTKTQSILGITRSGHVCICNPLRHIPSTAACSGIHASYSIHHRKCGGKGVSEEKEGFLYDIQS